MGSLYEHIVQLGQEKGFKTITALCREAGVPRATMTELKMGRSKDLSKPNAQKFAETLGVSLDVIYGEQKKAPAPEGERSVSDDDIKFALFGGDGDITDEMYEEVKRFAKLVKLREEAEKKGEL